MPMKLHNFASLNGQVAVYYDAGSTKKKLSEVCKSINIIAKVKTDFEKLDAQFKVQLAEGYKETMSPAAHDEIHAVWNKIYGPFSGHQGTDNLTPYMHQHRHFELIAPKGQINVRGRMALMKFLKTNGLDLPIEDFG